MGGITSRQGEGDAYLDEHLPEWSFSNLAKRPHLLPDGHEHLQVAQVVPMARRRRSEDEEKKENDEARGWATWNPWKEAEASAKRGRSFRYWYDNQMWTKSSWSWKGRSGESWWPSSSSSSWQGW